MLTTLHCKKRAKKSLRLLPLAHNSTPAILSKARLRTRLCASRLRFTRATANLAAGFLAHLITHTPFPVRAIQVDGGSEFMAEFEEACARLGIELFVLPPRSPKFNGHVERMQRTFREEFYTQPLPSGITELQKGALRLPGLLQP